MRPGDMRQFVAGNPLNFLHLQGKLTHHHGKSPSFLVKYHQNGGNCIASYVSLLRMVMNRPIW